MGLDGFHFLMLHNDNSDQRGWFPGSQRTGVEVTKRQIRFLVDMTFAMTGISS